MLNDLKETNATFWSPIIIFISLFFTALISYRATSQLIENHKWVIHSHQVIKELMVIMSALNEAESLKRGFIITNQASFLKGYNQALAVVHNHLQTLKFMVSDNLLQTQQVGALEKGLTARIQFLNVVLNTFREKGFQASQTLISNSREQQKTAELSALALAVLKQEEGLLEARSSQSEAASSHVFNGFMAGWLIMALLVFLSYFLLLKDLRQRKKINRALHKNKEILEQRITERTLDLERSNRELQEFAFIASHDLQEPLRKIQVFGDRLRDKTAEKLDSVSLDYLDRMQNAAVRMHRLINDLLAFSRISTQQEPWREVDLNKIAEDVKADLEGSLAYYQGSLILHPLPKIVADPVQIQQLLQNIVSNGLKFHKPNEPPAVSISWRNQAECEAALAADETPESYIIAVRDNGIGIDPEHADKIFALFKRLHGKNEYEGTGIGLAVCRKIIERHHGIIHVESAINEGSTFIITFPGAQRN